MPIYEYRCHDCGKTSELLVGMTQDDREVRCKYCGSNKMDKMLSRSNIAKQHGSGSYSGGQTCCGKDRPCDSPPCSDDGVCKR